MSPFSRRTDSGVPEVDVLTAHHRSPAVVLLDIREPSEWADGHAPATYHQPLGQLDPASLPDAVAVCVICRSGNRSASAARALRDAGVDAHNVTGGMIAWAATGLPVERAYSPIGQGRRTEPCAEK